MVLFCLDLYIRTSAPESPFSIYRLQKNWSNSRASSHCARSVDKPALALAQTQRRGLPRLLAGVGRRVSPHKSAFSCVAVSGFACEDAEPHTWKPWRGFCHFWSILYTEPSNFGRFRAQKMLLPFSIIENRSIGFSRPNNHWCQAGREGACFSWWGVSLRAAPGFARLLLFYRLFVLLYYYLLYDLSSHSRTDLMPPQ